MKFALLLIYFPFVAWADDLLLEHAKILDPATQSVIDGNLLISGDTISRVGEKRPENFKGKVLDLSGKWIIPGLVDMHTHSFGNGTADKGVFQFSGHEISSKLMLYTGVTAFLDLFADENDVFTIRDQQRVAHFSGADIFAAGPILTCANGHGTEYGINTRVVNTPAEVKKQVSELALRHPDIVKIAYDHARKFPSMDKATMEETIRSAKSFGLKTVVHIGTWVDAKEAVLAGADIITHIYEKDIPDELVQLMKERGTWMVPTMAIQSDLFNFVEKKFSLANPLLANVISPELTNYYRKLDVNNPNVKGYLHWQGGARESYARSLGKIRAAGIKIMVGTDAGNMGTFQGFSVHRELKLLVDAGYTSWEVLKAATVSPGLFLNQKWGIHAGDQASLVVLNQSPLVNIENSQDIALVIHHGQVMDRTKLIEKKSMVQVAGQQKTIVHGHSH